MTVANGNLANQTTFNNAFVSKTADSTVASKVNLNNDPGGGTSGDNIDDLQLTINKLAFKTVTTQSIGTNDTTAADVLKGMLAIKVIGDSNNPGNFADAPFGASGGWVDGYIIRLIGTSDTATVKMSDKPSTTHGAVLRTTDVTLKLDETLDLQYCTTRSRWIEISRQTTNEQVEGTLNVKGAVDLDSTLKVDGTLEVDGATQLDGATNIYNTLNVSGTTTAQAITATTVTTTGDITCGGNISADGTLTVKGSTIQLGDADTDAIDFQAEIGSNLVPDTETSTDLTIGTASKKWKDGHFSGTVNADTKVSAGAVDSTGDITIKTGSSLKIEDDAGGETVSITAPTTVTSYSLTMPSTQGAADKTLVNNGSGILSWGAAGGSGGTGKNYITNSDCASSVFLPWAVYDDEADTTDDTIPDDGTGGSPGVTIAANTTTPLSDDADFLFTKPTADSQGEGVSTVFTIDRADNAKKMIISFDYKTSANYVDDDVKIYIFDDDENEIIRVNGEDLKQIVE